MAGTRTPRSGRPRAAAKPKEPTATPTAAEPVASVDASLLEAGGWQAVGDGTWFHVRKSRGNFLPFDVALAHEQRVIQAAAEQLPDVNPDDLGVPVASSQATATADELGLPSENPLDLGEAPAPPEPATGPPPLTTPAAGTPAQPFPMTAEAAAVAADNEARERAIARAESPEGFGHDGIGDVSFWKCYACSADVRYAPHCPCPRCVAIRQANGACPFCGNAVPHGDGRR